MKPVLKAFLLLLALSLYFTPVAQASLKGYTYPYDISHIEWQILNWTAAYRNTTTPADPFTMERMEYSRSARKVIVYLSGKTDDATDENLAKSIRGISALFNRRFAKFDPVTDLFVYYKLKPAEGEDLSYKEYKGGTFVDTDSPPDQAAPEPASSGMAASSY